MAKPKYIDNDMQGFRDKKPGGLSTFNVLDYGATGDGTTDDATAIRQTIQAAMSTDKGGIVYFPAGVYKTSRMLVPAKGIGPYDTAEGWWADADDDQTLVFQGAGAHCTTIRASVSFGNGGIIAYGSSGTNPKLAQFICRDLTLDGNYDGVDSGTIAAVGSNQPALVSLGYPHQAISGTTRSGQWHYFERCRFYRPSGFCFQVLKGIHVSNCDFDQVGQPDGGASVHYDSLGGGEGDLIAVNNTWRNSKGNYVDMINPSSSLFIRAVFVGNVSVNHDEGGVYAAGQGSIIANNSLHNNSSGGGVGYDSGTHASARSQNIVCGNTLTNINVFSSGLSAANGDLVYGNVSLDSTSGVIETLGGVEVGGSLTVAVNTQLGGASQFGGGTGVIGITNASVVPSSNPTGGGVLYVQAGALKYRGSSGTVTNIANA